MNLGVFETDLTNERESVGVMNSSSKWLFRSSSSGVVVRSISRLLRFVYVNELRSTRC